MNLKKIVIHELIKKAQIIGAAINPSNVCLNSADNKPQQLNTKLAESFEISRNKLDYAIFLLDEAFPNSLKKYLDSNKTEDEFLDFSKNVLARLRDQITNIAPAKGGYLEF